MTPNHHKEIAKYFRGRFGEPAKVQSYRDDNEQREIRVGSFGPPNNCFYVTIGMCDRSFDVPAGSFEFAALGDLPWLPNAVVSSVYWIEERTVEHWPLICEDVVQQNANNANSIYRHMAYVPSASFLDVEGRKIRCLLGVPIRDSELQSNFAEVTTKVKNVYPEWLWAADE